MDREQVRQLEQEIEAAIASAVEKHLPRSETNHRLHERTCHLMAKAAVAVLEAVVMNSPDANRGQ